MDIETRAKRGYAPSVGETYADEPILNQNKIGGDIMYEKFKLLKGMFTLREVALYKIQAMSSKLRKNVHIDMYV